MISLEVSLLLFVLCGAFSLPVPTQLSKDDETVIKCISEILADTLSRSSPMLATSDCMKVLREDNRVLTMLHHRHLLTELEELAHQENTKNLLAHELNHNSRGEKQQGELEKRGEPAQQKEAVPEKIEEHAGEKEEEEKKEEKEEEEEVVTKKEEGSNNPKEKTEVSRGEELQDALNVRGEEEEEEEQEEEEEEGEIKKRASSETWQSKEYFGHIKNRGSRQPKIRKGMLQGDEEGQQRQGMGERRFRMEEEEGGDTSEEEEKRKYHHGGHSEEEEEEERRPAAAKRVAEKASDEETAQFEEEKEETGLKSSKPKAHLHQGWKPWQEEAEEEEEEESHSKVRHGHHHPSVDLDLKKKRYWKDQVDPSRGRHHASEGEEEEEKDARQKKAPEVDKLEEIERELKWAADKLEELKKG